MQPPGVVVQRIDKATGLLAAPGQESGTLDEVFLDGTAPDAAGPRRRRRAAAPTSCCCSSARRDGAARAQPSARSARVSRRPRDQLNGRACRDRGALSTELVDAVVQRQHPSRRRRGPCHRQERRIRDASAHAPSKGARGPVDRDRSSGASRGADRRGTRSAPTSLAIRRRGPVDPLDGRGAGGAGPAGLVADRASPSERPCRP